MRPERRSGPVSVATLATGIVAAVILAGCGGGGNGARAGERVRATPDKTLAAGTARVALNVGFSASGVSGAVKGDGLVDLTNRRGALTLDLGALGGSFGSGTVDTVLDGDGIFVKLPSAVLPGNKPWLRLNLATLSQQAGLNLGSLGQLQSADPSQALQFLKGAEDDMRKVGADKVRGASTTHYRGTVDLRKAAATLSPEAQQTVDQAISSLGTSTFPADVWIDGEGRMRKMSFRLDPDGSGPSQASTVEFELFDFGVKADVQPPPPDQVTDLADVFGGLPRS